MQAITVSEVKRYRAFFLTVDSHIQWTNKDFSSDAEAIADAKSKLRKGESVKVSTEDGRLVWDSELEPVSITLTLTPTQVTQLLTAVQVRSTQAYNLTKQPGFSQCDPINQDNLRAQSVIADEVLLMVKNALR